MRALGRVCESSPDFWPSALDGGTHSIVNYPPPVRYKRVE